VLGGEKVINESDEKPNDDQEENDGKTSEQSRFLV